MEPSRTFDEIRLGDRATLVRTWTDDETARCARLIGDANPLHLDEAYCRTTRFGRRIVHGVLTASMIPTLAGTLEVVGVNQRGDVVLRGRATVVPPRRPTPPAPLPPEAG